ncbi:MAG: cytochrome-c oxidase, cbb3-type subunit I [Acidobacteriota bacterium]|nr:cytochrome-c oxidase, cbb3-type subunit I [Acidobacteriota bacterium]
MTRRIVYDDAIVRAFSLATMIWGAVALLAGVLVASQLSFFQMNFNTSFLQFGRLRPLHTNAAIFALVGNMMFAGIYHSTQRLTRARMGSDFLSWFHFWGWQLIIVSAAVTLPLGLTQSKEYAELIWPIDIAVVLVWVAFAVNFFWTLAKRNEKNLYVALWFYIATIVTVAVLYIVNNLQIPTSLFHSYSIFTGAQDALVQWWYGHNAVAFFLTTPILGIMYYYLPKAAERPVYSYRLSIVHFWSLVFIYIWAGPHHLLNTSLPDWVQSLGMVFSLMLWAPSWGGMLNGLLTLRGAWNKLRTDPVIKFYVVAVTFYGMSTFEGPLLSIKSVNALGHYTDWIIGHVHSGALGWNGFMAAGMLYWLVPRMWKTKLFSKRLAEAHFWIGTFGILLYVVSMWISGVSQGLFWRAMDPDGFLKFPDFIEGLVASRYMYHMRLMGGLAYLAGWIMLLFNLFATIRAGSPAKVEIEVPMERAKEPGFFRLVFSPPVLVSLVVILATIVLGVSGIVASIVTLVLIEILVVGIILVYAKNRSGGNWHDLIERNWAAFTVLVLVAVLIGGLVELIPTIVKYGKADAAMVAHTQPPEQYDFIQRPYSPLELEGRDVYIAEGCYVCHSQMIRTFRHEVLRYGEYSRLQEFVYDTPFQWGSKRTGPDLHRVGGKYANLWHYLHLQDPRSTSPGSNMPSYDFLAETSVDQAGTAVKMRALQKIGVPYTEEEIEDAMAMQQSQAKLITDDLAAQSVDLDPGSQMTALIAYLQRLGRGPQPIGPEPMVAAGPPTSGSPEAADPDPAPSADADPAEPASASTASASGGE